MTTFFFLLLILWTVLLILSFFVAIVSDPMSYDCGLCMLDPYFRFWVNIILWYVMFSPRKKKIILVLYGLFLFSSKKKNRDCYGFWRTWDDMMLILSNFRSFSRKKIVKKQKFSEGFNVLENYFTQQKIVFDLLLVETYFWAIKTFFHTRLCFYTRYFWTQRYTVFKFFSTNDHYPALKITTSSGARN